MNRGHMALALVSAALFLCGCATPPVPRSLRESVTPGVSFKDVLARPEAHAGEIVLWAGEVLSLKNEKDQTVVEVLQIPCNTRGTPRSREESEGRFLVAFQRYLDEAVYKAGRTVTVVGQVQGVRRQALGSGKADYAYPLLLGQYIYLWPRRQPPPPYDPPYWNSVYWHGPGYWDPWWGLPRYPYGTEPALIIREPPKRDVKPHK